MIDYGQVNRDKRKHKAALTRARNSGDPKKVIAACNAAFADFDKHGWPDQWADWQRAKDDAILKLARGDN